VVAARHPAMVGERVVKRVVGLAGDWVQEGGEDGQSCVLVPQGHCYLSGDNEPYSLDSRHYGPVPLALLVGKVVGVVWWDGFGSGDDGTEGKGKWRSGTRSDEPWNILGWRIKPIRNGLEPVEEELYPVG